MHTQPCNVKLIVPTKLTGKHRVNSSYTQNVPGVWFVYEQENVTSHDIVNEWRVCKTLP